ncbi:MAG: hypothetical protein RIA65_14730 [Woeseia sp.]
MNSLTSVILTLVVSLLSAQAVLGEEGVESPEVMAHPGAVALSETKPGEWSYKAFPSLRPLYVNENDSDGKSSCDDSCASAWPPLRADEEGAVVGDWKVIERDNGELQWAYKGQPVHQRFHDSVTNPRGDGLDGFHLLKP